MRDVAVIGGGVIGTAAAAYLAEAGASVVLFEASAIGAGASGRNSGAIQHPYDALFAELYQRTLPLYRELAEREPEFEFGSQPDGLLLVSADEAAVLRATTDLRASTPELDPTFVGAADMRSLEPATARGVAGCLLATGYAVVPASATEAFARRALRAGAEIRVGEPARPIIRAGRAVGIAVGAADSIDVGSVLVAGGPWSSELVPGWGERPPISRLWGVVATVELQQRPRRILEELSIDAGGSAEPVAFSLVTAGNSTSLGSTFLTDEPDPSELLDQLRVRGARFVPGLAGSATTSVRVCARPVSFDGRPLIGPVPGVDRLYVCAGHGPWGISTGPASARLVVDAMLKNDAAGVPEGLAAGRY